MPGRFNYMPSTKPSRPAASKSQKPKVTKKSSTPGPAPESAPASEPASTAESTPGADLHEFEADK